LFLWKKGGKGKTYDVRGGERKKSEVISVDDIQVFHGGRHHNTRQGAWKKTRSASSFVRKAQARGGECVGYDAVEPSLKEEQRTATIRELKERHFTLAGRCMSRKGAVKISPAQRDEGNFWDHLVYHEGENYWVQSAV